MIQNFAQTHAKLACPTCHAELSIVHGEITCPACGRLGRVINGVPCFTNPEYYWGEISRERMQEVNRLADAGDWRQAVEDVVADRRLRAYITEKGRADFQYIWDIPPAARILDVGAGWGAITAALAENFGSVTAVEGVLERARFIGTRAYQSNLSNIQVVCADFLRVPLAPAQFDVAVLNGVLEWVALNATGNPREIQLEFLRTIRKLLKRGGMACIAIENRIGWAALRGGVDHSGFRYTSLMPRVLASAYCRWQKRDYRSSANVAYRTYTYSLAGYRSLFKEAGFGRVQVFHPWNGYNDPSILLPLGEPNALLRFVDTQLRSSHSRKQRLKAVALRAAARTGLWAQLASDYTFLAENS